MIKANELRIGNKVKMKVPTSVDNEWFETTIEAADLLGIERGDNLIEGIPLTPEILEKCGFEKKTGSAPGIGDFYWHDNGIFETIRVHGDIIKLEGIDSIPVKHLHQLQNLYFALTGEELEIKSLQSDNALHTPAK